MRGARLGIEPRMKKRFLDAGYVLFSVDYRLAPGAKVADMIEDIQDAYAWIRQHGPKLYNIDVGKIPVYGSSAGGYLTLLSGVCFEPKPPVLLSMWGFCDIETGWPTKPDIWTWPKDVTGLDPAYPSEAYDPFCPVRSVTAQYPPTFPMHGENDADVPFQQSVLMNVIGRVKTGHWGAG